MDKPVSPRRKRAGIQESRLTLTRFFLQGWHISPGKMDLATRLYGCLLVFYFSSLVYGDPGKLGGFIPNHQHFSPHLYRFLFVCFNSNPIACIFFLPYSLRFIVSYMDRGCLACVIYHQNVFWRNLEATGVKSAIPFFSDAEITFCLDRKEKYRFIRKIKIIQ